MSFHPDPDQLLTRKQTADELTKAGYPIAPGTFSTMACRLGGPPYSMFGPTRDVPMGDALLWAQARVSPARRTSAEHFVELPPDPRRLRRKQGSEGTGLGVGPTTA